MTPGPINYALSSRTGEGSEKCIGIVGAGIMGSGIAQVAAVHGCHVQLLDANQQIVEHALCDIGKRLDRLVDKGQMSPEQRERALRRLDAVTDANTLATCDLVLEAVSEDL